MLRRHGQARGLEERGDGGVGEVVLLYGGFGGGEVRDFGVNGAVAAEEGEEGLRSGVGEFFTHGCGGCVRRCEVVVWAADAGGGGGGDRGQSRVGCYCVCWV